MKRILFFAVLILAGSMIFAQSDELDSWSRAFDRAQTVSEQLIYVRSVAEGNYSGAVSFYAKALDRLLIQYPDLTTIAEWDAADTSARILVEKLGEARHAESGLNLWRTVEYFSNPLVKAEALMALGKTGNRAFLPQVIQILNDLNTRPQSDIFLRESSERIAYGAIISLENYKAPEGYLPVFFANTGWYADRIRTQASISLGIILEDPTEPLLSVIQNSGNSYEIRHVALRTSERSQSSNENKAKVAVAALIEGWRQQVSDQVQRQHLYQMRLLALNMLRRYGTQDPAVYPPMDRSYMNGDMDEKLATLQALAALASEDSARLLSGYLNTIHIRRVSNILTPADEQLVRVIIPALGTVGSVGRIHSRPILVQVQQSNDWTNAVKNLAADALRRIGQ